MKSKTIKKLYTLHSWVGIITGILLFVIAFTGAVSVFGRPEIKLWANPEIRALAPIDTVKIERLIEEYAEKVPEHYKEEVLVFLPAVRSSTRLSIMFESHHGEPQGETELAEDEQPPLPVATIFEFDPITYELVDKNTGLVENLFADSQYDMSEFIVGFHADLHMGRPIGLLTTGILGLTMMLSIVTGIFIHRKILAQLFTFRPHKTYSLMLTDGHKAIGVWGLLFNSVIAFTGAFLGLAIVVLVPAAAFVSFGGDQDKLLETFTSVSAPIIQNIAQPTSVASAFEHALAEDVKVSTMTIKGYGDKSAMMYLNVISSDSIATQTAVYHGNGEFKELYGNFGRLDGYSGAILDVMFPLHFGNFGGIFVKIIWAILGLGTALLPLTGMMLWIERAVNSTYPKYSMKTYQRFNRLIVGGCGGIVVATFLLFPANVCLKYILVVDNVGPAIWWPFFGSWLGISIWSFIAPCEKQFTKQLTVLTAIILMTLLPIDLVISGQDMFSNFTYGHQVSVGIDLTCFAIALYLFKLLKQVKPYTKRENVNTAIMQEGV